MKDYKKQLEKAKSLNDEVKAEELRKLTEEFPETRNKALLKRIEEIESQLFVKVDDDEIFYYRGKVETGWILKKGGTIPDDNDLEEANKKLNELLNNK